MNKFESELELVIERSWLEGQAAVVVGIVLAEGSAAASAYIERVGYRERLEAFKAAGGLR